MRYRHILPLLLMAFSSALYAGSCPEYLNHAIPDNASRAILSGSLIDNETPHQSVVIT